MYNFYVYYNYSGEKDRWNYHLTMFANHTDKGTNRKDVKENVQLINTPQMLINVNGGGG
jgi:hypothetical protein